MTSEHLQYFKNTNQMGKTIRNNSAISFCVVSFQSIAYVQSTDTSTVEYVNAKA